MKRNLKTIIELFPSCSKTTLLQELRELEAELGELLAVAREYKDADLVEGRNGGYARGKIFAFKQILGEA